VRNFHLFGLTTAGMVGFGIFSSSPIAALVAAKPPDTQPSSAIAPSYPRLATDPASAAKFEQVKNYAIAQKLHKRPMPEIIQVIATQFLDSPYEVGILERTKTEELVVRLDKFDCVLFVETVLAIAHGVSLEDYSHEKFAFLIENLRYRDGHLNGYCSRLHYFSEWIIDNQKRALVGDITARSGGLPLAQTLNFMSQHRVSYPQLAQDDSAYECIKAQESRLASLPTFYIPTNQVRNSYDKMRSGDIVAIATKIKGLDVTHTGLVYIAIDGKVGLIHASPSGKVKISPDLQTYVQGVKEQSGIMLVRFNDPR
jgi:hypothetical protein